MIHRINIPCIPRRFDNDVLPYNLLWEHGGSVVECRAPEREVGVRNLPPPCCVLEQDTLLPESTG